MTVTMYRRWNARRLGTLLVLLLLFPVLASAQQRSSSEEPLPTVTRAYAIENARIVQAPGRVIERGTVVVRNGLIEAVGPDARVPSDAQRIEGDSLVVYAGFIDGLSVAGLPAPPDDEAGSSRPERPGDPPFDRAGIQPQRKASGLLDPGQKSIGELRNTGFTAAHVTPHGQSISGIGTVILLGGTDAAAMVLKDDASLFMQFEGARGVYPATDMAVLARIRQLYREAERRAHVEELYRESPSGMERPSFDEVYGAFYPTIRGERPVVFHTTGNSGALQIHRVLALQEQLGFPLIVAGANQAFDVVEPLRKAGHPVILTLGLPDEPKSMRDSTGAEADSARAMTPEAPSSHFVTDHRTRSFADVQTERDHLMARQEAARAQYLATASDLHRAGIAFAFSTREAKPSDLHKNLRLIIAEGLPEDAALAALTTNAAAILGVERQLGTVDAGKIANLVLADGPLFAEETKLRRVFVDGVPYDVDHKETPQESDSTTADADPTGEWAYTAMTPDSETTGVIAIEQRGRSVTGTITIDGRAGAMEISDAKVARNLLTFRFIAPGIGSLDAAVTLEGETFDGLLTVPDRGTFRLTGQRMFGPDIR